MRTLITCAAAAVLAVLTAASAAAHDFDCEKTVGLVVPGQEGVAIGADGLPTFLSPPTTTFTLDRYPALVGFKIRVTNVASEPSLISTATDSLTDGLAGALAFGAALAPGDSLPVGAVEERVVVVPVASYEACLALGGAPEDLACRPDGTVDNRFAITHNVGAVECRARLVCVPAEPSCTATSCDDGNACTTDTCDAELGCVHVPKGCDDGNACTGDACDPATGCTNTAVGCDDGNACTADACDPATGCTTTPVGCDDGNACTADACDPATGCTSTAVGCDDGNACTAEACDPATGCTNTAVGCDDGNACTADACDPAAGCTSTAVGCDDGNACTADACNPATGCTNTAVGCDDGNACTADACDPATGCTNVAVSCNDANACTADACNPAVGCTSTPIGCDDGNACTADACDPATGCTSTAVSCDDANACTADACDPATGCTSTAVSCDDGIACTVDSCAAATGCAHVPSAALCDDGNVCTANTCTPTGCASMPVNGIPCGNGGTCAGGTCRVRTDPSWTGVLQLGSPDAAVYSAALGIAPTGEVQFAGLLQYFDYDYSHDPFVGSVSATGVAGPLVPRGLPSWYGSYIDLAIDAEGALHLVDFEAAPNVRKVLADGTLAWEQTLMMTPMSVAVDATGNVYVAGYQYAASTVAAVLAKLDAAGDVLWMQEVSAATMAEGYGVGVGPDGDVFVAGVAYTPGTLGGALPDDAFLARFAPDGTQLWLTLLGSPTSFEVGRAVAVDTAGYALLAGSTTGVLGAASAGGQDAFVARIDPDGAVVWTTQLGSVGDDNANAIAVDAAGAAWIVGTATDALPGQAALGGWDVLLAKLDAAGNVTVVRQHGTVANEQGYDVALDGTGRPFVTGYTEGAWGGVLPTFVADAFVLGLDAAGGY